MAEVRGSDSGVKGRGLIFVTVDIIFFGFLSLLGH